MNAVVLSFLTFSISAEINTYFGLRNIRSVSEKSFEEQVKEGYELLKGRPNAYETMNLVLRLHKMENEIADQLTPPAEHDSHLLDEMTDEVEIEDDHMQPKEESIEEINQQSKVAVTLYQGDMMLTKEQADDILEEIEENKNNRNKRQALRDRYLNATWKDGVFYYFYSNASEGTRRVFKKAADEWQSETCVNFYDNDKAPDRIVVFEDVGCYSDVGRIGGEQGLSLGPRCGSIRNTLHEIGHALGFFHTQSRHDRNNFIRFYQKNLKPEAAHQFTKQTKRTNNNFGLTYDYGSVMHYGARGSSKNRKPVMIPHDKNYLYTLGSPMISFYDTLMMNTLYGCLDNCKKGHSAVCQNGGFPHPRNCSKCICPSGYGGTFCHRRVKPTGCGRTLNAASFFLTLRDEVGKKESYSIRDTFSKCFYWIKAPVGSRVEVVLHSYDDDVATEGCRYAGVEIKTGSDKRLTGYRFCSPKNNGTTLISTHNIVPIITYSNTYKVRTILRYRIAPDTSEKSETSQPTSDDHCSESSLCPKLLEWHSCNCSTYRKLIKEVCPISCGLCPQSPPA